MKFTYHMKEIVQKEIDLDGDFFYPHNQYGWATTKSKQWEELCYAVCGGEKGHEALIDSMHDINSSVNQGSLIFNFNETAKRAKAIWNIFYPEGK